MKFPRWKRSRHLSVVDHPSSVHEQQHVVDSLFNVFGQDVKTTRPGSQRGLVLLLSHLIGYSLGEFGLWGRSWLLRGGATVAKPISEGLVGFLQTNKKTSLITQCWYVHGLQRMN